MTSLPEPTDIIPTDTKGRVRTSPERREALLAEFDRSQMTGAAFARWAGIKYPTFMSWLSKRESEKQSSGPPKTIPSGAWLEAVVDASGDQLGRSQDTHPPGSVRVDFGAGVTLSISTPAQAILAAEIIRQLRGASSC